MKKFNMIIPKEILFFLNVLNDNNYEAYLVGGCVRDMLLNKKPNDYDITTNAKPDEVIECFTKAEDLYHKKIKVIPTGLKHGTVTIVYYTDNNNIVTAEITTYRIETIYEDYRHPKEIIFANSIKEDLSRRDFTINAMAYSPLYGFCDPFNGELDIKNKIIRCVGNPNQRFNEDALRLLRAVRFAKRLSFELEENTKNAIKENHHLLKHISKERIIDEFYKILSASYGDGLNCLFELGLLSEISIELYNCFNCEQNNPNHFTNVGLHTCYALNAVEKYVNKEDEFKFKTILFAVLLHDIGKPISKTTKNNCDHFYNHPIISVDIAQNFLTEYRFSNKEKTMILNLIRFHDIDLNPTQHCLYKSLVKHCIYYETMESLVLVKKCDIEAQKNTTEKNEIVSEMQEFFQLYITIVSKINKEKVVPYKLKDLNVNGNDIKKLLPDIKPEKIKNVLFEYLTICFYNPNKNSKDEFSKFLIKNKKRLCK